ncbi:2-hydroxyacid dehydrogenase [Aquicoccus sp. G2-2]|uniref:2-hydroxyacid dehydrogenase n=1 Tax=Aquicoccus sp. G2-2 TaxID=3092120 RepID=UPI002ADF247F|nr:NAD(P)-dependent oxidoreductase [Aquicoccus sp. G2-2]MEA1112828.1 NAD(P)-dependent oxidoreductase [Aquicoccus sp. G2-2]
MPTPPTDQRTRAALALPIAPDLLGEHDGAFRFEDLTAHPPGGAAWIAAAKGASALVAAPVVTLNRAVLSALAPDLRLVSSFSAGVDYIDLDAARDLGIAVANTGSHVAGPTAEITLLLILAAARQVTGALSAVKSGAWANGQRQTPQGITLSGRTLGIVGLGHIGREVARRAAGFDMRIIYHNRRPLAADRAMGAQYCSDLDTLLAQADIVSLHCPLTAQTRGMINTRTLARMQAGAVLINTARGELLDDVAVTEALESGHLAAAGLDVFANEPRAHPYYMASDKVFTLPHIGTATPGARRAMAAGALDNLARYFTGRDIPDLLVQGRPAEEERNR